MCKKRKERGNKKPVVITAEQKSSRKNTGQGCSSK